jgi:hypothetical protein
MNLQPKCLARSRPSKGTHGTLVTICIFEIEKCARTIHANLALVLKIAFVRDDNDGEGVLILNTEYLLVEGANFLERVA